MSESEELQKLRKDYEKLIKKHGLPPFDKFDQEFELRTSSSDGFISKEARRVIISRLQDYTHLLDPVLNPHAGSLHSMIESDGFNEEEKKHLFELYKKLGHLIHSGILAGLQGERAEINFIKQCWNDWPNIKKEIINFTTKTASLWKTNHSDIEEAEYMS
jgi:hypothetical protein